MDPPSPLFDEAMFDVEQEVEAGLEAEAGMSPRRPMFEDENEDVGQVDDADFVDEAEEGAGVDPRGMPPVPLFPTPQQQQPQGHPGVAPQLADDASQNESEVDYSRMRVNMDTLEGYNSMMMGEGIEPIPAAFNVGLDGVWTTYDRNLFPDRRNAPRPVRALVVNVPLDDLVQDAQVVGDFETHDDPAAAARAVARATLLSMLTVGTSKGWTSGAHAEITKAIIGGMEGEELAKFKAALDGNVTSYTFCPLADDPLHENREVQCMQFGWVMEELYDEAGDAVVAHRYWKLIYDRSHSDDELQAKTMKETSEIFRTGHANQMPEKKRRANMEKAYKLQCMMTNTDNLSRTACTMNKRVKYNQDLEELYKNYAGATDAHDGYPLFANMRRQLPPACKSQPLTSHPVYGGANPLGPSYALNAKRDGPMLAGLVNKHGNKIKIHKSQRRSAPYFQRSGNDTPNEAFIPPPFVEGKGAMHMCHSPVMNNLMTAPLPRPVHGNILPDDILLEMFFEVRGDKNHCISNLKKSANVTEASQCMEELKTQFFSFMTAKDQTSETIQQSVLGNSMLQGDSLDTTSILNMSDVSLDLRCYGQNTDGNYVVEPRQRLKEISYDTCRAFTMIQEWVEIQKERIDAAKWKYRIDHRIKHNVLDKDHKGLCKLAVQMTSQLDERFRKATDAVILMGLQRFDHAFTSAQMQTAIPAGWIDIWKGTKEAIREAGELCEKGYKVDPSSPNARVGTANMAFAFGSETTSSDMSPW